MTSLHDQLHKITANTSHQIINALYNDLDQLKRYQSSLAELESKIDSLLSDRLDLLNSLAMFTAQKRTTQSPVAKELDATFTKAPYCANAHWPARLFPIYNSSQSFNIQQPIPVDHDGYVYIANLKHRIKKNTQTAKLFDGFTQEINVSTWSTLTLNHLRKFNETEEQYLYSISSLSIPLSAELAGIPHRLASTLHKVFQTESQLHTTCIASPFRSFTSPLSIDTAFNAFKSPSIPNPFNYSIIDNIFTDLNSSLCLLSQSDSGSAHLAYLRHRLSAKHLRSRLIVIVNADCLDFVYDLNCLVNQGFGHNFGQLNNLKLVLPMPKISHAFHDCFLFLIQCENAREDWPISLHKVNQFLFPFANKVLKSPLVLPSINSPFSPCNVTIQKSEWNTLWAHEMRSRKNLFETRPRNWDAIGESFDCITKHLYQCPYPWVRQVLRFKTDPTPPCSISDTYTMIYMLFSDLCKDIYFGVVNVPPPLKVEIRERNFRFINEVGEDPGKV